MIRKKIQKVFLFLGCFISFWSCAPYSTIGMQPHIFSTKGKHIIWIQFDGLLAEHLPLLKYSKKSAQEITSFERMSCLGRLWGYNLFDLRPKNGLGFIDQILGTKNTSGACEDIDRRPVWSFYQEKGYRVGIFESEGMVRGKRNESLDRYASCLGEIDLLKNTFLWKREIVKEKDLTKGDIHFFHLQKDGGLDDAGVYFDKSCQSGFCFIDYLTNIRTMWEKFKNKNAKTFVVIREKRYSDLLKKKDILGAKRILEQWDGFLSHFIEKVEKDSLSIIVSSSGGIGLNFPKKGRDWVKFEEKGEGLLYKNQILTSNIWAIGAGTENFCGIYDESQVARRFLWSPEKRFFEKFY